MAYENIPQELKALRQWICWKSEPTDTGKPTKIPYAPLSGRLASVTDPSTWASFDDAVAAVWPNSYSGIGFVFTRNDPYAGIDLDATDDQEALARQRAIFEAFDSYSELSPSGQGLHIIVKASLPHGRKRAAIELYSSDRYFTFTGNIYRDAPIAERQELTQRLWDEMGPAAQPNYFVGTEAPEMFDDELIAKIKSAANGELFWQLFTGDWQHRYKSQSEADQALMNFLAFHSQNRPQIMRVFRQSALGQRQKAGRDKYLAYTIDRAFDQLLPPVDISGLIDQINRVVSATSMTDTASQPPSVAGHMAVEPARGLSIAPPAANPPNFYEGFDLDLWRRETPAGAIGLAAEFVFRQAPRPVREIALVAALGFLAGIAGRAWNVSGTGLNLYLMMLAPTGRGKEAMATGINSIASAVERNHHFEAIWQFIGPGDMASGAGLLRHLSERITPSFVSLTGEIGLRLQQMSSGNANIADITLRRALLDLYAKSGGGQVVRPSVYSDKKNNVEAIHSPAFTWLGESTPEEFYKSLDESHIASGLVPRFTIIEYTGIRVPWNDHAAKVTPSPTLTAAIHAVADQALKMMEQKSVQPVNFTQQAHEYSVRVNNFADSKINALGTEGNAIAQLWNRLHLKALKIAALLAVSQQPLNPVIDLAHIEWATSLCLTDTVAMVRKFEQGQVGGEDHVEDNKQFAAARHAIKRYLLGQIGHMKAGDFAARDKGLVTASFLATTLRSIACFRKDKRGGKEALKRTLEDLEFRGMLTRVPKQQAVDLIGSESLTYAIVNPQAYVDE